MKAALAFQGSWELWQFVGHTCFRSRILLDSTEEARRVCLASPRRLTQSPSRAARGRMGRAQASPRTGLGLQPPGPNWEQGPLSLELYFNQGQRCVLW